MTQDSIYNTVVPDFDEASQSQIPAILQLINMGWEYISRKETMDLRGGSKRQYLLKSIAMESLKKINSDVISDKSISDSLDILMGFTKKDGLQTASEEVYKLIIAGKSVSEFINGRKVSPQLRYIDFENPENNSFHVSAEFEISETELRRPDIVLFVNGIPFAVIENKKSAVRVQEALNQMVHNQKADETPLFFLTTQFLIGCNSIDFKYGTGGTPTKLYSHWREKDIPEDVFQKNVDNLINIPVSDSIVRKVSLDLLRSRFVQEKRIATTQDKGIYSLLQKKKILDLIKTFTVYDAGVKKVARYQQYFAINKILKRIDEFNEHGRRKGGLVWHTQGSGKSLTMVMFVKAIIEAKNIINPRVIVVTDRLSLNQQIKDTFNDCGIKKKVIEATTRKDLIKKLKSKTTDVITTLVGRFEKSLSEPDFIDDDKNVFILIDEAHRSQGGLSNYSMNTILPNACQIAFTGTPLMKKDKKSVDKFGGYIDIYTIKEATDDGAVLPLVYEGRYANQEVQSSMLDKYFDRISENLSEKEKEDLKKKFASSRILYEIENTVKAIALDIDEHYVSNFKKTGLKAQLVATSKYTAILFKEALDLLGNIKSEVIISDVNTHEDTDNIPEHKKVVEKFLKDIREKHGDLKKREEAIIKDFKKNIAGTEILIVVSKLLTGFDAPRNKVLYLTKELKDHNLLQAVARVNRLFDGDKGKPKKTEGLIIDYSKNAENLKNAMDLFSNYDEKDIENLLLNTEDKITELTDTYQSILNIFKKISNKNDTEEYIKVLNDFKTREDFKEKVNKFVSVFSTCLALRDFSKQIGTKKVEKLALDLKKFVNLKKTISSKFGEHVDFSKYEDQIRKILGSYVQTYEVEALTKPINLSNDIEFNQYIEDQKNGLSDKSKAEAIGYQTMKTISQNESKDPIFYNSFSEKINKLLLDLKDARKEDIEKLLYTAKEFQKSVSDYEDQDIPDEIKEEKNLHSFYRMLKSIIKTDDVKKVIIITNSIFDTIKKSKIVDWHLSSSVKREVFGKIDDFLYDIVRGEYNIPLSAEKMDQIIENSWNIAVENREKNCG